MIFTPLGEPTKNKKNKDISGKHSTESDLVVEIAEVILEEVLGREKYLQIKPLFLKNRTLTITCNNSIVAPELMAHQQEIVDKINLKLGKNDVDRIRYLL